MRMRRKSKLDNRIEICGSFLVAEPEKYCGCWLESFNFNELHIELGCGKGLFTAEKAKSEPDILLVGLEKISNVLVIALERAMKEDLKNVRYINRLADDILSFFAESEVSKIYLNFCDPWPARRHAKRRLTGECFLEMYKKILRSGGEIHFKTDNLPLFEFSLNEFKRCGFTLSEISYNLHENEIAGIMTDYESKFYEKGIPINRCVAIV